ncbi:unnamed protein product [Vicia faba]|uniref:Uncharacterized protein n=1 Tax=Vicia faba TaxID=3906 RepID=A0AAV0YUZ9_VICFA|nr:unnamed protein product [Vicia faba]
MIEALEVAGVSGVVLGINYQPEISYHRHSSLLHLLLLLLAFAAAVYALNALAPQVSALKAFLKVAATCNDLHELQASTVDARDETGGHVSQVDFEAISQGCRKLESILFFCQTMTNTTVVAMSKNCPNLVVFFLCIIGVHHHDAVTQEPVDEGFGAIVMNCKKLTLAVSGMLTDHVQIHWKIW